MAAVLAVDEEAAPPEAPAPRAPLPETELRRTPTILQLESVECGAAALAMILAHHGRYVPLEQMRVDCGVSRDGSKAGGLLRAARAHGMTARGFKKEPDAIAQLPMPAIVFWNFNHFVVLEGFRNGRAYLNDPARGRRRVDAAEFDAAFTGVVLTFEPGPGFERGGEAPSVLRSLRQHLAGFHGAIGMGIFLGLVLVVPGVVMPWLLGRFVDEVLVAKSDAVAIPLLTGLVVAAIARSAVVMLQAQLMMHTFGRAARGSARRFLAHALALPMTFYSQRSAGEIASRVDLNERVAQAISADFARLALDFITASFFLVLMARMQPQLALVVVACLALELFAWRALAQRTAEASQELSVQAGKLAGVATGGLANIESVKAGGQETALFLKWIGLQVQYVNASIRAQRFILTLGQAPAVLGLIAHLSVLGLGAVFIMQGTFSVGDLVAFQVLLAGFSAPVQALYAHTQALQTLRGDLQRIDDVLHHEVEEGITVDVQAPAIPAPAMAGAVEFRNVTFGYSRGDAPLIEDLSLHVKPGGRVALVGASGSGKSTVAKLAAGLYRPWSGEILFDGQPRDMYERAHLADAVAYVDQDIALFEGTVRDNLTLWNGAQDDVLRACLRDAAIEGEILMRPGGLDAPLQEGARNLSGGQRQRLEIARALVRSPRVLILDEATSALDTETEKKIDDNLRRRGCTCVVVAHRLSTIRDADEIIVLQFGNVMQRGTHDEMLRDKEGLYAQLIGGE